MTLAIRPTFSESWYRVAAVKARLRSTAQISRQFYRGDRWYVVRDPAGNQFHRLSEGAYRFVGLLDGSRTVAEAWESVGGQLEDGAPTQPEVIQIMSQLYSANLLEANISPDAAVLLRRHTQQKKRELQGRLMNILFPRIPLWDPDRFLKRWMPVMRVIMSPVGAILWVALIIAAVVAIVPHGSEMSQAAAKTVDIKQNPENAFFLWLMFVMIKAIHELGHAFACRRFGGEVHELGIMFLVFIPTPYVDASTAWAFPSRWSRMFVGAAGMVFELGVAAVAAFIWLNTKGGAYPLVNQLAFNCMLIASVTTVIFNANPLLRYDGYYMLSDMLEIPNLQHKSSEYSLGLIKRHLFRVKQTQPLPPIKQRIWMFFYSIFSSIYRVFVGLTIILLVTFTVPVLGVLMALGGVVTWVVMPVVKTTKYLALNAELHRKRGPAVAYTLAFVVLVAFAVGWIDVPVRYSVEGVGDPAEKEVMRTEVAGWVKRIVADDGRPIKKGDVIVELTNPNIRSRIRMLQEQIVEAEAVLRQMRVENPGMEDNALEKVELLRKELAEEQRREKALLIRAPFDGIVIGPSGGVRQFNGAYLKEGMEMATVATFDKLKFRGTIDQKDAELGIREIIERDPRPKVRPVGDVNTEIEGYGTKRLTPQDDLPSAALSNYAGGTVPTDQKEKTKSQIPQFGIEFFIDNPHGVLAPGQRMQAMFTDSKKHSLAWNWSRRFWQIVQGQSQATKWM